ncbi:MAG: hypothetical protein KatS3mg131_3555 [Candidatus Tectimicrobiota bacterium]|nr:MAG: hypothetical protein KatS3mg131_3555 [Candidatus Tectomicrobia bacterium]
MPRRSRPQTIEYAFRFAGGSEAERARMVEMIRVNLEALLQRVVLTHEGRPVVVDGFRLRDDPSTTYPLSLPEAAPQPPNP